MTSETASFFISFAILLFAFGLISRRISGTVITAPMIFVAAGFLLSPAELDLVKFSSNSTLVLTIAELALILTLFSDASMLELHILLREEKLPRRLLFIALPLIIASGTIVAFFLFKDLTFAEAGLIGAILSPTDASLGQAIVNNPKVPLKIRQSLNLESGLNDGGAIPFFLFFLILISGQILKRPVGTLIFLAFEQIGLGLLVGIAIGFIGGKLSNRAFLAGWTSGLYRKIGFMAMAIACWLIADTIGGSGFIAAFVGGFVSRVANSSEHTEEEVILTEAGGNLEFCSLLYLWNYNSYKNLCNYVANINLCDFEPYPHPHNTCSNIRYKYEISPQNHTFSWLVWAKGAGVNCPTFDCHGKNRRHWG